MPRSTPRPSPAAKPVAFAQQPRNLFAGTSGWAYPTWKPGFYPAKTPARSFLEFYASELNSVEVNYTFRELPTEAQLQGWLDATPSHFRFGFKAPQRITHFQRLLESHDNVDEFVAALEPARAAGKLGPLLFQLPPNFAADNTRLADFLKHPAFTTNRVALEFRSRSWFTEKTYSILRHHNVAMCIAESDDLATPEVSTANFHYYRLRRNGGYKPAALKTFGKRFAALANESEVFIYFKHEDEPTGALNAVDFLKSAAKASKTGAS